MTAHVRWTSHAGITWTVAICRDGEYDLPEARTPPEAGDLPEDVREALTDWLQRGNP